MKKQRLLDTIGNYLCTIGLSGEKIYISIIPFVVSILVFLLFRSGWNGFADALLDKVAALKMDESILEHAQFLLKCTSIAMFFAMLLMFWQRAIGSVNAMQNAVSAVYFLTVAFSVIGKVVVDILDKNIEKDLLPLLLYIVTTVVFLVVVCIVGVICTVLCAPQAIALAMMIGIPLDLLVIFIRSKKIAETRCWKDTLACMENCDLENEVYEVQLTESGVYFVNPDNRVITCVNFASRDFPHLNYWARKVYIAMLMKEMPKGYVVESLNNMFVAVNYSLKRRLNRDDASRRRNDLKENRRRRSEGKTW